MNETTISELNQKIELLSAALTNIDDPRNMSSFLKDLCTPAEIEAMADRWNIVVLLNNGTSYREISTSLGASTATISRVARALKYGDGYQKALNYQ